MFYNMVMSFFIRWFWNWNQRTQINLVNTLEQISPQLCMKIVSIYSSPFIHNGIHRHHVHCIKNSIEFAWYHNCEIGKEIYLINRKNPNTKHASFPTTLLKQENVRTVRLCPLLWKTTTVVVLFYSCQSMVTFYTYNHNFLGFCEVSSQCMSRTEATHLSPNFF